MRFILALCFAVIAADVANAQSQKAFTKAMKQLRAFAQKDSASVQLKVNRWWEERKRKDQVPLTSSDSAVFIYRGNATSVSWAGDFNGWGSKPFQNQGSRIANTDIWALACAFPPTARLDYKIILNGKDWILDPVNPHQQYSGVGGGSPNSEIRMPGWKVDPNQVKRPGVPSGTLNARRISSTALGYEIGYSVYMPAGTPTNAVLPTFYVTDGSEYLDPRLGNMTVTLDNLIADRKIPPLRIVFVDARDPSALQSNRRMQEMSLNEKYLMFFTDELIPAVEGAGSPSGQAASRGILGTSLGGLNSVYFAFKRPDVFQRVGIQSPAFWYKQEIYTIVEQSAARSMKIAMTAGTIYDTSAEAQKMKALFDKLGHSCLYIETAEGHSWGNWKNLLDDILIALYH